MNREFRESVWRCGFRPLAESEEFEASLRAKLGLESKYESARLAIGRSLADPAAPAPIEGRQERGKSIAGEFLFGDECDLWIATFISDGQLGLDASLDDFKVHVEAHWARGSRMLRDEFIEVGEDETRFLQRLSEILPEVVEGTGAPPLEGGKVGIVAIPVGKVSQTHPGNVPVELVLNGPGIAPHIALMGKNGSGKTTTGVQLAAAIKSTAQIPMLFIDPKGEFVEKGRLAGALAQSGLDISPIEVGDMPIPLDFLPKNTVGSTNITRAAMQFRDSLAACCNGVGNIQQQFLRDAVETVIKDDPTRNLEAVRARYQIELQKAGKSPDSVSSRLSELTSLKVFDAELSPREFFGKSWVLSLKSVGSEELKRLVILLLLDALRSFMLSQPESAAPGGFRTLRHLLVIDEARRVLADKKHQSLVDLVRQGRSKGVVVMLLSQDPSDFEGQADDFTQQLGTVIAFACSQSRTGLRALQGAYGRKLQSQEFVDTYLPPGVAFAKLPNREAERIRCWQPGA